MARIICTVTNDLTYDRRMQRICRSLCLAGHEVTLIGRKLPRSRPLRTELYLQHRIACYFQKGKAFYLEYNLRLLAFLLREPFDIVCGVDLDTLVPALLASRRNGARCVYDAHEYFSEVPEVVSRPIVKWIWEKVAAWAIPRVDAAYTVGDALARQLATRYGKPFSVVRNVPYKRPHVPGHEVPRRPVLLYQGALNEGRGLECALEAMLSLPEAELWLAGEGDLSGKLRAMASDLGLDGRVKFLGLVEPEALDKLTDQASLGLNLLENRGLSYYYSAANKAYDYIQAGLPSLQMNFPEYRSLNERYGVFCLLEDLRPDRIAREIQRLFRDPEHYSTLAAACRKAAGELNWEKEEKALRDIYSRL